MRNRCYELCDVQKESTKLYNVKEKKRGKNK